MQMSLELGKDEEELLTWPKDKFERWVAYFRVEAERTKQRKPAR